MTHEDHITEHLVTALTNEEGAGSDHIPVNILLVEDVSGNVSLSSSIDFS